MYKKKSPVFKVFLFCFSSGSVDGNNQLIIRGKYNQKQIENVLRRYISKYWFNSRSKMNFSQIEMFIIGC